MRERDTRESILHERRPRTAAQLAQELGVGVDIVQHTIDGLIKDGYGIARSGETIIHTRSPKEGTIFDLSKKLQRHLHFGVVSDTHLGSKLERLDAMERAYDTFKREGIHHVFHVGDMTDGVGVYQGQEFELHKHGQQEQIDYAIDKYPQRSGITTHFITGNHDLKQYQRGGVDPGRPINSRRRDMNYLGQIDATVLLPEGVEMELTHPGGGNAYALSYKAQKAINAMPSEDLPDILLWGHYHTSFYMRYRNVEFLQVPALKDGGLWEKSLGMNTVIGGWLVDGVISPDSGRIASFKPNLVTYGRK
jgi:predicted phosphodiesterase